MKKTLLLSTIISFAIIPTFGFANTTAKTENIPATQHYSLYSESILQNIILPLVKQTQADLSLLKKSLPNTHSPKQILPLYQQFIKDFKGVQASYILGSLDFDQIDGIRFMDNFHQGNENLAEQLKRAIKSGEEPQYALFKHSYNTVNALEFILFSNPNKLSKIQKDYAKYIINNIENRLNEIHRNYESHAKKFNVDQDKAMSYLLETLVDISYKTKEWRVGEPAGLTRKYQNNPDYKRQEYLYSHSSFAALAGILNTFNLLLSPQHFINISDYVKSQHNQQATLALTQIQILIKQAIKQTQALQKDKTAVKFEANKIKPLYQTLDQLNDMIYISLIKGLPVQSIILDADGD